jgi:CSLREA domain-containing protein
MTGLLVLGSALALPLLLYAPLASAHGRDEGSTRQCDNGRDDDLDGFVDWRPDGSGDPDCERPSDESEFPRPPRVRVNGPTLRVTTFDDELNADGDCSLREAVEAANTDLAVDGCPAGDGADAIKLRTGSYVLSVGQLTISSDLMIRGARSGRTIIDAARLDRVITVAAGTVELSRLTFQNGLSSSSGGGILNQGALTLTRSTVRGNTAGSTAPTLPGRAGGISNRGMMAIVDSFVVGNSSPSGFDGGIFNARGATLTIDESTIGGNTAHLSNGGITNEGAMLIADSLIVGNVAERDFNGGIFNATGAALVLDGSTVGGNTADRSNGGIGNLGTMEIVDSAVVDNIATREFHGGIFNDTGATLTLVNSTVSGNTAGRSVGGISNLRTMLIVDSSVTDNVATGEFNGGIFNGAGATLTLVNSAVRGNRANRSNGGIGNEGTMEILGSSIVGNAAVREFNGGIFNATGATLTLMNSTVSGNTANFSFGGAFSLGTLELVNSTVSDNHARVNGGLSGSVTLRNSIVAGNAGRQCMGAVVSAGHNLDSDDTCNLTEAGDMPAVDPMLGPLADNGGPTETHALLPGSPAIDAIAEADCVDLAGNPVAEDQRGVDRPHGLGCDIGAFEWSGEDEE